MRSASTALKTYLPLSRQLMFADLYTITLKNGTILRLAGNIDRDVTYSGNVYKTTPLVKRSGLRYVIGMEADQLNLTLFPQPTDLAFGSVPILQAIAKGFFDGASVQLDRLYMPTFGDTSLGAVTMFLGTVGNIQAGRTSAILQVDSDLIKFNVQVPRNLVQPACYHTLFDAGCTLNPATYQVSSSVGSSSTAKAILCSLAQAAGYFDLGKITFTSGQNAGVTTSVQTYTPGSIVLPIALPFAPQVGDTFNIWPGCDKLQTTCNTKFVNITNYGGQPYVPVPETAI